MITRSFASPIQSTFDTKRAMPTRRNGGRTHA
jgi:hypothetical protein